MSRESQLVKNTFILSLGSFLPKLVSFITLPIITGCLTKAELGHYDLISTLVSLIIPVATLQIHSGAFRFLIESRKDPVRSGSIISSIAAFCLPVMLLVSALVALIYPGFDWKLRVLLGLYFLLDGLSITMGQILRGLGHNRYYSANAIITAVVSCICIVLTVYNARLGLYGIILSYVISLTVSLCYAFFRAGLGRYLSRTAASREMMKELIAYSWPMIPNNLSNWVLSLSDRFVITGFLGIEANAVYAVANKIPNIIRIGQTILIMAWQESAALAVKDEDAGAYYSKMFGHMLSILVGFTALLIGFAPLLFRIFIRGDYGESYPQLPILFLGILFSCMASFMGGIYVAHKKTKNVGVTTIGAAAINLAVDFLLINRVGIYAGSISTLAAYLALYVIRCVNVRRFQPMEFQVGKQIVYFLIILGMLVLCYLNRPVLNILNAAAGVVVFVVFNLDTLKALYNKAKKMIAGKKE